MYDLHIHTSHSSDGQYGPDEILESAQESGLKGLAFTDHMDISAVPESLLLAPAYGLICFAGVELSTVLSGREYHLLVYGYHADDESMKGFLEQRCRMIWDKVHDVLAIFSRMGFDIRPEDIKNWGRSVPSGVSFLNALMKRNRSDKRLQKYLSGPKSRSPYLNFYKDYAMTDIGMIVRSALPDLIETMKLMKGSGLLILAHPGDVDSSLLKELKDEGLAGIEAYSTYHTVETSKRLVAEARSLDLLVSAGTDFHGELIKPGIRLGEMSGQPDEGLIAMLKGMAGG
ncbi:MAG TPA: PHP domain-containing protein [Desulfomonilia bacterium]|nr:PHP domain-containing protein [Desulfomonilia bacterium]